MVGQEEEEVLRVVEPLSREDEDPTVAAVAVTVMAMATATATAMIIPTTTTIPTTTIIMAAEMALVEVALAIMTGGITRTALEATPIAVALVVGAGMLAGEEDGDEVEDVVVLLVAVVVGVGAALLVIGAVSLDTSPMPAPIIRA